MAATRSMLLLACFARTALLVAQDVEAPPVRTFEPYQAPVVRADTPVIKAPTGEVQWMEGEGIGKLMTHYTGMKDELKGYRVQIFLGERKQAEQLRAQFLQKHPDIPAYLSYQAPNFKVRVGDLRDRLEAERLRETLRAEHPGGFIVQDDIELPALAP
jgi:hypothetical protein